MPYDSKASRDKAKPDNLVARYVGEWKSWREDLRQYWPQIDKNQEMYEFYKREASETEADVSLNTPFTIVEALVAKFNEAKLTISVKAKGQNDLEEFESYIASLTHDAIEDQDVADVVGSFRKKKEEYAREFFVKGNAVAEVKWLYKTVVSADGGKKVVADNPYLTVIPFKRYIFNPAQDFATSRVKYIEKYVRWQELKDNEHDPKLGRGLYKNLAELKKHIHGEDDDRLEDDSEEQLISGDRKVSRKKEPIHLLERWEGSKICVIANQKVIIREDYDPMKIGRDPIVASMNYKVVGRPYAYGEVDAIYKPVRAQDTVVNQAIQVVNRYLRPAVFVKDTQADLDAIVEVLENGGVTFGDPASIAPPPMNTPPQQAFLTIDVLQQGIERAARFSPYSTGVPSQQTDKTQGTLGGIARLQAAAEPNFQVKLDTLQDSFMRPLARLYLQMIGALMGEDEVRYGILRDKTPQWVKATKGVLRGRATVDDLLAVGMIAQEEVADPQTGMPLPGISEAIVFDVDWVVEVKLDNQAKADRLAEAQSKMAWVNWARELGVQFNPQRTATRFGYAFGEDDPESLYMTEEEMAAQAQQAMQQEQRALQQRAQMDMAKQRQASELKMREQAASNLMAQDRQAQSARADLLKEQLRGQAQLQRASLPGA